MAQRVEHHPLEAAFAALLANGLDGAGEALRILVAIPLLGSTEWVPLKDVGTVSRH